MARRTLLAQLRLSDLLEEFALDVTDSLREGIDELLEVLFVKEELVLLVLLLTDAFALSNCNVEIFLRLRRLHIEEVSALPSTNPARKDLLFVAVFQG